MNRGETKSNPVKNHISELVDKAARAVKTKKEDEVGLLVLSEEAEFKIASEKVKRSLEKALKSEIPVNKIPAMMKLTSQETRVAGGVDKFGVHSKTGKKVQPVTDDIVKHLLETPEMKIILLEKEKATLKAELDEAKKKLKKNARHLVELQSVIVKNRVKNGTQIIFDLNKTWQGGRKTRRKKTNKRKKKRKSKKRKRKKNN